MAKNDLVRISLLAARSLEFLGRHLYSHHGQAKVTKILLITRQPRGNSADVCALKHIITFFRRIRIPACRILIYPSLCTTVRPLVGSQNDRRAEEFFVKFNFGGFSEGCLLI